MHVTSVYLIQLEEQTISRKTCFSEGDKRHLLKVGTYGNVFVMWTVFFMFQAINNKDTRQ